MFFVCRCRIRFCRRAVTLPYHNFIELHDLTGSVGRRPPIDALFYGGGGLGIDLWICWARHSVCSIVLVFFSCCPAPLDLSIPRLGPPEPFGSIIFEIDENSASFECILRATSVLAFAFTVIIPARIEQLHDDGFASGSITNFNFFSFDVRGPPFLLISFSALMRIIEKRGNVANFDRIN